MTNKSDKMEPRESNLYETLKYNREKMVCLQHEGYEPKGNGVRTFTRTRRTDYVQYTLHLESFLTNGG